MTSGHTRLVVLGEDLTDGISPAVHANLVDVGLEVIGRAGVAVAVSLQVSSPTLQAAGGYPRGSLGCYSGRHKG